jgi:hypothetical protein
LTVKKNDYPQQVLKAIVIAGVAQRRPAISCLSIFFLTGDFCFRSNDGVFSILGQTCGYSLKKIS